MISNLDLIASIAEAQTGLHEEPRGSNRGAQIQKFFNADNYDPIAGPGDHGYPWCASFVCWVIQEFLRRDATGRYADIKAPRTAAAFGLIDWARAQSPRVQIISPASCSPAGIPWPKRGDIVVYGFSHCGIVTWSKPPERFLDAIEGNTDRAGSREGWEVSRKGRKFSTVKAFLRLVPKEVR
jgi:hypothetical protein